MAATWAHIELLDMAGAGAGEAGVELAGVLFRELDGVTRFLSVITTAGAFW